MGSVTYRDGIAILQLVVFPFILAAAVFIWSRSGWRVGGMIWRYAVTLSLIRIAGSISSLLSISHDSYNIEVAVAVCEMIGLTPLLLAYIGILKQIDVDHRMPRRPMLLLTLAGFIGLVLGILGVSLASHDKPYHPGSLVKGAMGIYLAMFVLFVLSAAWLYVEIRLTLKNFQRKLFLAIALSTPFLALRLIYSALSDFSSNSDFAIIDYDTSTQSTNNTVYLCMDVLEEIIAMVITMILGMSAVLESDFVRLTLPQTNSGQKVEHA